MQKRKSRKPRVRRKLVNGEWYHVYRVVVEQVRHQSIIIEARTRDEAERQSCEVAEHNPENWREEDITPRDCTSAEMTDGSWESCNALKEE